MTEKKKIPPPKKLNAKEKCWAASVIINGICSKLRYGATVPIMTLSESLAALSSLLRDCLNISRQA